MIEAVLKNASKCSLRCQMTWVQILAWPLLSCVKKKKKLPSPSLSLLMEVEIIRIVHISQRTCANELLSVKCLAYRGCSINTGYYHHVILFSILSSAHFHEHIIPRVRNAVCGHKCFTCLQSILQWWLSIHSWSEHQITWECVNG